MSYLRPVKVSVLRLRQKNRINHTLQALMSSPSLTHSKVLPHEFADRRRRPRLRLAYPLRLLPADRRSSIETTTVDISCEGFFCLTESTLKLREKLDCELVIPAGKDDPEALEETIVLRLHAEVVRIVRHSSDSPFGIGCRIADYTINCDFERHLAELV